MVKSIEKGVIDNNIINFKIINGLTKIFFKKGCRHLSKMNTSSPKRKY